jgi:hypothetical protein
MFLRFVTPAQAGVHLSMSRTAKAWIPAFAGMTPLERGGAQHRKRPTGYSIAASPTTSNRLLQMPRMFRVGNGRFVKGNAYRRN